MMINTAATVDSRGNTLRTTFERFLGQSAYGVLGLPMAVLWVSIFVPMVAVSATMLIVGIGFPLLTATLRMAGIGASVERWLLDETIKTKIDPQPRSVTSTGWRRTIIDPLRDESYWRELAFLAIRSIVGVLVGAIVLGVWLFPVVAFSSLIWGWFAGPGLSGIVTLMLLGVITVVLGPFLVHAMTQLQLAVARGLLGPGHRELAERADAAQRTRDLSIGAAEAERRRIERDLHDGAQARLATVAMDLGRAKRKLENTETDPEVAKIIDGAHDDAKAAIVELRNLARGIHPAVLTDRGLDAALSELAVRCEVPVNLNVQLELRPAPHIESAAYFAASELLANISKHAKATQAWVTVRSNEQFLQLDVSDDGIGGADPTIGTGLHGLHDRIAGLDGELSVRSALGEGTNVFVEIPMTTVER